MISTILPTSITSVLLLISTIDAHLYVNTDNTSFVLTIGFTGSKLADEKMEENVVISSYDLLHYLNALMRERKLPLGPYLNNLREINISLVHSYLQQNYSPYTTG